MAVNRQLLRIEAPHFVAGIVFGRDANGHWFASHREAAPILRWMSGKSANQVHGWLRRKNYSYQWVSK